VLLAAAVSCLCVGLFADTSAAYQPSRSPLQRQAITPATYASIASGVALIKTFTCSGRPLAQGTGFLVGSRVLMTARHVIAEVKGACIVRAYMGNSSYTGSFIRFWSSSATNQGSVDLATMKLNRVAVNDYVFSFAPRTPPLGTTIAMIGHPLGNPLSLAQGPLRFVGTISGLPEIGVVLATAQGSSGSPLLDPNGDVVGILQKGFVSPSAGRVVGLNLAKAWGKKQALRDLCKAYPLGGIAGCGATTPPPPPPPSTAVTVTRAYMTATNSGGDTAQTTFATAPQFVAYAQFDFASAVKGQHTISVDSVDPNGTRVHQCGGAVGVGWKSAFCKINLTAPIAGNWTVAYSVDGQLRGSVAFQITAPSPSLIPGQYCGFTEQGPGLCMTTSADGTQLTTFQTSAILDCSGSGGSFKDTVTVTLQDTVPIQADGSFAYQYNGSLTDSSGQTTNIQENEFITGTFTSLGTADGRVGITSLSFDYQGQHYTCTQGAVGWHTKKQ
jgi:Trypsin-like peptidase domain